jgi:hypothetical protein
MSIVSGGISSWRFSAGCGEVFVIIAEQGGHLSTQRQRLRAKTRTRQHIIADLSFNHFERHVLECGHIAEPVWHDYGYDVIVFTYTAQGELEPGQILVQLKATDRANRLNRRAIQMFADLRNETLT